MKKKSWEEFGSCLLNSTANLYHFHLNWAGLAVLFSRQLQNGSHECFSYFWYIFFNYLLENSQTTIALNFLTHIILDVGGVI